MASNAVQPPILPPPRSQSRKTLALCRLGRKQGLQAQRVELLRLLAGLKPNLQALLLLQPCRANRAVQCVGAEAGSRTSPTCRLISLWRFGQLVSSSGALEPLTDVSQQIVVLLHPRDLLNLARTSKEWRAFLMNRRQEPLWKASRTRQEPTLPDLPPFLSEPAYANLMFFKHCSVSLSSRIANARSTSEIIVQGCLKPTAHNVYWEFGLRLCDPECSSLL